MKRKIGVLIMCGMMVLGLTGCNKMIVDTTFSFNKAYINTGSEVIVIEVASWTDYEDGDQLQIKAKDGKIYLVSAQNCVLVKE